MPNFWKIECLSCGSNCDLLMSKHKKVICRECLDENELTEVDSELEDFDEDRTHKMDVLDADIE